MLVLRKTTIFFMLSYPLHRIFLPVMPTIALVDDHKIFCDSLQSLLGDIEGWRFYWLGFHRVVLMRLKDYNLIPRF